MDGHEHGGLKGQTEAAGAQSKVTGTRWGLDNSRALRSVGSTVRSHHAWGMMDASEVRSPGAGTASWSTQRPVGRLLLSQAHGEHTGTDGSPRGSRGCRSSR